MSAVWTAGPPGYVTAALSPAQLCDDVRFAIDQFFELDRATRIAERCITDEEVVELIENIDFAGVAVLFQQILALASAGLHVPTLEPSPEGTP